MSAAGAHSRNPERSSRKISDQVGAIKCLRENWEATMILTRVALFLLLATHCLAADSEPYLKSAPMPFYPRVARLARLSAQVN